MENNITPLERAFELAKSGQFTNVADIKRHLGQEGLSSEQVTGRTLMNQLRELIRTAAEPKSG
ncbi:hypothetical protein WH91_01715 [Devosia psychrophila]|uniref:Uncharacterized protein n=1 Tax=Devosia psychrophila TaxID=728005 RepID=A0A0F5Q160_9HYPH|nr:hypothetical protein WH91_01715 [Devosia psychrophila]SFD00202.1 hypothetical protein SAMN04488059_11722 [Devosia psychrophila]